MSENARIISLVPSWTETFINAGACVVGRTQFCIYPADSISGIPNVGGTKNINLAKILQLKPDLIILDKQENTRPMAEALKAEGIELLISDVTDFESVASFLSEAAQRLKNKNLLDLSQRYLRLIQLKQNIDMKKFWSEIFINGQSDFQNQQVDYVIWKSPFMVIGKNTFIAENLKLIGLSVRHEQKYPEIDEEQLKKSFCLFSSEPYPFAKKFEELSKQGFRGALIDGEKLSWYGIRNLTFLERCLK